MSNIPSEQELYARAIELLPYEPTERQDNILKALCDFAINHGRIDTFILHGYAGTGKSSLVAALVQAMTAFRMKCVMLAPTGRAAKVLAGYSSLPAFTIHKRLYRAGTTDPENTSFFLVPNRDRDTLFVVDEASMIPGSQHSRLLQHLISHVYGSPGCAIIFLGDTAQLPPVGEVESVALTPERLQNYGLVPHLFLLDQPLRQAARSGILYNATRIRRRMHKNPLPLPELWKRKFPDVEIVSGEYLSESLSESYMRVGQENTLVVTRSNRRATAFNNAIRGRVLYAEAELVHRDRLVIAKNNYFWTARMKEAQFIANGETAIVQHINQRESRYGYDWADVELFLPDSNLELEVKLNLGSLLNEAPALTTEENVRLYRTILAEKEREGIGAGSLLSAMRNDPYVNAIQAKYAYCLTCHKAQGGQWEHLYIDLAGIREDMLATPDFYRWLYTAITRATSRLFLISPSLRVL